jgi:hypothetical protein
MVFSPLVCFVPHAPRDQALTVSAKLDKRLSAVRPSHYRQVSHRLYAETSIDADLELLPSIREAIQESADENSVVAWNECLELVSSKSGLSPELSELALAKANGWKAWVKVKSKLAKKYMKTSIPDKAKLEAALDWSLSGPLSWSQEQLARAIDSAPDVYLLDPAATYAKALSVAPEPYQEPEKFIVLALQDPSVLSCTFNCVEQGCSSECGNCWVSYENGKSNQQGIIDR